MKTIWKYELEIKKYQEIEVPKGSKVLCAKVIQNKGYIWMQSELKNNGKTEIRKFITVPTGHQFEEAGVYIDTLFYQDGTYVQHLYEV